MSKWINRGDWVPNTDVYTKERGLVVDVELAGMGREELEIYLDGQRLIVRGQRRDGCRVTKCSFLAMRIHFGIFETAIEVPQGYDLSRVKAQYSNGILRIEVPRNAG